MHISEWQCISRSDEAYFGVAKAYFRSGKSIFSEWHCIFQSGNAYFRVAMHISEWTMTRADPGFFNRGGGDIIGGNLIIYDVEGGEPTNEVPA